MTGQTSRSRVGIYVFGVVSVCIVGVLAYFFVFNIQAEDSAQQNLPPEPEPYVVPPLAGEQYIHDTLRFRLQLPDGFSAREMQGTDGVGTTIILEDAEANGIQIATQPFDEDLRVLTKERVQSDIPDMQIIEPQPVDIGTSHIGLAFKSDNPAFSGASREVWFVFNGTLYQISTYERLDSLLKTMFQTWEFF